MSRALANALSRLACPFGAARHVHPLLGFVGVATGGATSAGSAVPHTHEIASVTSYDIPVGPSHAHVLFAVTGPAVAPEVAGAVLQAACGSQAPSIAAGPPIVAAQPVAAGAPTAGTAGAAAGSATAAAAAELPAATAAAAQLTTGVAGPLAAAAAGPVPEPLALVAPMLAQLSATNLPLAAALAGLFPNVATALGLPAAVCAAPGAIAAGAVTQPQAVPPQALFQLPSAGTLASLLLPTATTAPLGSAPLGTAPLQVPGFPLPTAVPGAALQVAAVPGAVLPLAQPLPAAAPVFPQVLAGAACAPGAFLGALAQAQPGVAAVPGLAAPQVQFYPGPGAVLGAAVQGVPSQVIAAAPPEIPAGLPQTGQVVAGAEVAGVPAVCGPIAAAAPAPAPEVIRPVRRLPVPESLIRQGNTVIARESGVVISQGS